MEIVYELKVTPEEEAAAMKLELPSNFYAYLRKPPCPGCVGCENDSDAEVEVKVCLTTVAYETEYCILGVVFHIVYGALLIA